MGLLLPENVSKEGLHPIGASLVPGGRSGNRGLQRPGRPIAIVEIHSVLRIKDGDTAGLQWFVSDFGDCEAFLLGRDPHEKRIGAVLCFPWQAGLQELGL